MILFWQTDCHLLMKAVILLKLIDYMIIQPRIFYRGAKLKFLLLDLN